MGKIKVLTRIWNFADELEYLKGQRRKEDIREISVDALVDRGAMTVSLPEDLVNHLGLIYGKKVPVRYHKNGNNEKEERPIAYGAKIEIIGREGEFDVLVGRSGTDVLIGQLVLERLDLVPDPKRGVLGPRPESPDMPLIDML